MKSKWSVIVEFSKGVVAGGSLFFLMGCAATQLKPGAERIILSKNAAPKGCKFVAALVGNQGGSFAGGWTSNKNLAQGAMNDIRNQALEAGANYVQLETDRAGSTGSGSISGSGGFLYGSSHSAQTDVTMSGNAYKCNPTDIGLE
jgi:hypothetical protein